MSFPHTYSGWTTKILKIVSTVLLCVILIMGIALLTIPLFSDTDWIKHSVLTMLNTSTESSLSLEHLKVDLFPSPHIVVTGLIIISEAPDPAFSFKAKQVELGFEWTSLWQDDLVFTQSVLLEPELTVMIFPDRASTEPVEWTFPSLRELRIYDGRVHLLKKFSGRVPMKWTWENIQVGIIGKEPEGSATLQLTGESRHPDSTSSLALQGTLTFIDQSPPSGPETRNTGIPPLNFQGEVEISNEHLGRMASFFFDSFEELPSVSMNVLSRFNLTLKRDIQRVIFPHLQLSLNEWNITAEGRITDLQTDSPNLMLSGSTNSISIGRLLDLLPVLWLPVEAREFISERHVKGTLELISGTVEGTLNHSDPLIAEGIIRVENGRFLIEPGHPPITQLSGTVALHGKGLTIQQARGKLAPFILSVPEAIIGFQDAGPAITIPTFSVSEQDWTLTGRITYTPREPASPVLEVSGSAPPISLQHLVRLFPEDWIAPPIQDILRNRQVDGMIELVTGSITGPLQGEHPMATEGVLRVEQGHLLVDSNYPPLTHLEGSVAFNSNLIRILDVRSLMGSSNLLIKEATIELNEPTISIDLKGGGDFLAEDIVLALLRDPRTRDTVQSLAGYTDIQGHIRVGTHLAGPVSRPENLRILQGNLVLDQVSLYPKEDGLPLTGIEGLLGFDHRRLNIRSLTGHLGTSPLSVTGQWDFQKGTRSSNLVVRSQFASSDLLKVFPALSETFAIFSGAFDTTLTLSGSTSSPSYRLHVDLTDSALAASGVLTKPAHIPGTFAATGKISDFQQIILTHGELALPPFKLDVIGSVNLQDPLNIKIGLQTESGTGALLPKGMILGDERLGLSTLALDFNLHGQGQDWTTWTSQGTVESTNRRREAQGGGGSDLENKSVKLTWIQKDQQAHADFSLHNFLVESFTPSDPIPRITGGLTLQTAMTLNLTRPEWIERPVDGNGKFRLTNGRIVASPLLSKILGLLNVPNLLLGKINLLESGFPVDVFTGTFSVKDALLSTKDSVLKSPVMTLAAAGTYDLPSDRFDGIVTVSPFGAYSSLLKSLPLFGTLLKGERKGLTTALFSVKGPRTDPQVTYLPLQSVTEGILGLAEFPLDVLKNVLTLPAGGEHVP